MATKLWCPSHGDPVRHLDGSLGAVTTKDKNPAYDYEAEVWEVEVKQLGNTTTEWVEYNDTTKEWQVIDE